MAPGPGTSAVAVSTIAARAKRLRHAADLTQPGLPPEAVPEAFSILRDEIGLLNRCRADVMPVYLR